MYPLQLHKTYKNKKKTKSLGLLTQTIFTESVIIQKLNHVDDRVDIDELNLTPVQEFYKDAKIFVTGGTGFLGKILIEKLLRSCPVSTIYVLIRSKKGKDSAARLNTIFEDQLFNRMKKACPDFRQKVVIVEGDCQLPELGLAVQDKKMLIDEVSPFCI